MWRSKARNGDVYKESIVLLIRQRYTLTQIDYESRAFAVSV
jgi:hypothetical protein